MKPLLVSASAFLLLLGCARVTERVPRRIRHEVATAVAPWMRCPPDEVSVVHPRVIPLKEFYFAQGCGTSENAVRVCSEERCGIRTMKEGRAMVSDIGQCPVADLRYKFERPDTLYIGGCGELWILSLGVDSWNFEERGPEQPLLFPEPAR